MRQLVLSAARRGAPSLTLRSSSNCMMMATAPSARAAARARRPLPLPRAASAAAPTIIDGPVPWPGAPDADLDARPPLTILRYPDPRLRAPNASLGPAAFAPGPAARRLSDLAAAMTELMYELSNPL
jgi:hypothetical protein